jgi:PAS domain S-box-containing protein
LPAIGTRAVDVLLIEDDPHAANLFLERTRHFAPGEFNITQARTLQSALDDAEDTSYSLAVLDLTLPDSSGIETCSRFSSAHPDIPFIVLTGVTDGSLVETLSRAGAIAALLKDDCSGQDIVNAMRTAHASAESRYTPKAVAAVAEARFRNAIIDSADGIVVVDAAGEVLLVSSGAESLLGRTAAEMTGSPLGLELKPGAPVRAQMLREEPGHAETHNAVGPVRQFDTCQLHLSEIEFWPFSHHWSGKPVTVCAMRDISNQSAEEHRQRNMLKIDQSLEVTAGIEAVCADLAIRLGSIVKFNRFEATVWSPETNRLQVLFELGVPSVGRERSAVFERNVVPKEFRSWITEWSTEELSPRVAVSVGCVAPDMYRDRDEVVLARCASMVAEALRQRRNSPVFAVSTDVPEISAVSRHSVPSGGYMPGAA